MLYKSLVFAASFIGAFAQQSIVDTAIATADLSTLVAVLSDAAFEPVLTALSGAGPFTVFAPTNAAFAAANIDLTFAQNNVALVTSVLQYHVVGAKAMSSDLAEGSNFFDSLQGTTLRVALAANGVTVNGNSKVTTADVDCTNGVVHIVDAVIMPIPLSIVANAQATATLSTLVTVLTTPAYSAVLDLLSMAGPFTVFAPTDAAFAAAGIDVAYVNETANVDAVIEVLKYHVVSGAAVFAGDLAATQNFTTVEGKDITVTMDTNGVMINSDATVTIPDVQSSNGVVHVIDKVLTPTAPTPAAPTPAPDIGGASVATVSAAAIAAVALAL